MVRIDATKAHRFNVDERFWCLHTKKRIQAGTSILIGTLIVAIKDIIRDRPSIYHKEHNYYEIKTT